MKLLCRFHPQAWLNGYAIDVDCEGEPLFEVEWPESSPIPQDNSTASDELRTEKAAPRWVQEWSGPYYITIVNRAD